MQTRRGAEGNGDQRLLADHDGSRTRERRCLALTSTARLEARRGSQNDYQIITVFGLCTLLHMLGHTTILKKLEP